MARQLGKINLIIMFAALQGCALLTATPPRVEVAQVQLRGIGPEQAFQVVLCVTNPNDSTELSFRQVQVALDVEGAPLANSVSEAPVRVPPRTSTAVPFAVTTTARNLGPQLLGVLRSGALRYRVHGTVQLEGSLAIRLPFSRSGKLDVISVGDSLMADGGLSATTRCGPVSIRL